MLLELARIKYGQTSLKESYQEKNDLPIVCPYCDYIFTANEEGEIECPKCHWGFEIDDDGDVISYDDDVSSVRGEQIN
ncbi:hypothetical protein THIOM_003977 [Candidatus Thiomargarita nelsonii]|uniref:Uncharacterized protein n=1 Tax=Candidatus Thiomargarita nelsonii TaxID=1003181 RepID=A0A0A6P070_9GAMM|nr:hypothetical protein THIOM_003977 [Candidatus Thiomargarita nelsonii]